MILIRQGELGKKKTMNKQHKNISKLMSLVLRHQPEYIDVELDENGWLDVNELISGINRKGINADNDLIKEIVVSNGKQRFIFNEDQTRIRANQGHSVNVDVELKQVIPPEYLFHGTVPRFMENIEVEGLKKMSRNHVHLSEEKETALNVGSRRGKPIVLTVKSGEMHRDAIAFYRSENGVWLTGNVVPKYIEFTR